MDGTAWSRSRFLLFVRWIVFLPIGFALSSLLYVATLFLLVWMTGNDGRTLVKDIFDSGYVFISLLAGGAGAFAIATLTTSIAPRKRVGAFLFGTLYAIYMLSNLRYAVTQNKISPVVAVIILVALAIGCFAGLRSAYVNERRTGTAASGAAA